MIIRRALAAVLALLAVAAAPAAAQFTPGAAGGGDPFYPSGGNGGYDVKNYVVNHRPRAGPPGGSATPSCSTTGRICG